VIVVNFNFGQLPLDQIRELLGQVSFPITRENLVQFARQRGANDAIVGVLEKLPDKLFDSQQDILQNLQKGLGNIGLGGFKL
jgi:hypothetical protein